MGTVSPNNLNTITLKKFNVHPDTGLKQQVLPFSPDIFFTSSFENKSKINHARIHRERSRFWQKEQAGFNLSDRRDPIYYFLHRWMEKEVHHTGGGSYLGGFLLQVYSLAKNIFWFVFGSIPLMAATRHLSTSSDEPDWEKEYTPEERKMSKLDKALYWLFFKNAKVPTEDEKDRVTWATKTPYQRRPRTHDP